MIACCNEHVLAVIHSPVPSVQIAFKTLKQLLAFEVQNTEHFPTLFVTSHSLQSFK